ncbi:MULTISPECIES: hypothetical protein [Nitrosococcus]|uniref:Uncharacterized protein n=3 Tax=Nitrosococcus TaxID=1227 RepID=Q3JF46_NITOC|nr:MULTISPECIES: hypothetical protein [Nitrosococcus]KFI17771.1 hypothetical protein IB75_18605 [Nitrosococcus oceani C-27]ABA56550.1 hypothetical protein Noc_A0037 [Nitrosococcus oceani ATCC 19707]ADJ29879.1 conserved hypothetical protein [Nitrosococcus watsonii C-113]EDZ65239.1 hypothetical protein NOC27_3403 [Nitrosococcus oceani AFC27]BBM60826.1 hypothetical protein NONS58_P0400 [Nitrosococcus oceani]
MKHDYFTVEDALKLLGQRRRAKVKFPWAPRGTTGTVTRVDAGVVPGGCTVAIEWDVLEIKPMMDWFTKDEYEGLLEKI